MRALAMVGLLVGFGAGIARPTDAQRAADLRSACLARHDAVSCEKLAARLETGMPAYAEEPGLFYAVACESGRVVACDRAQRWAAAYADYEIFELDVGCMLRGNAFACEEVGNDLRGESDEAEVITPSVAALARSRIARAARMYTQACDHGDAESCLGLSRVHRGGFGVEWNLRLAQAYAARACALGLTRACAS